MTAARFEPGLWVALVTPMVKGEVDHDKLRALVERHVEAGTTGLVPCGTTGESATFSHAEHRAVVETVVDQAKGRLGVMAGTGSNSTREAVSLTQHAKEVGATGALVITPYYNKPSDAGLRAHFSAVAEAVEGFPVCLYNVPGRTACDLKPETAADLHKAYPWINAIKEAAGDIERVSVLRRLAPGLDVFSGDDGLTLGMLALGAKGVVSVAGNLVPGLVLSMVKSALANDFNAARELHDRLHPLMKGLFIETNPIPIKSAMAMIGAMDEDYRLPLVPPQESTRVRLRELLAELDLI